MFSNQPSPIFRLPLANLCAHWPTLQSARSLLAASIHYFAAGRSVVSPSLGAVHIWHPQMFLELLTPSPTHTACQYYRLLFVPPFWCGRHKSPSCLPHSIFLRGIKTPRRKLRLQGKDGPLLRRRCNGMKSPLSPFSVGRSAYGLQWLNMTQVNEKANYSVKCCHFGQDSYTNHDFELCQNNQEWLQSPFQMSEPVRRRFHECNERDNCPSYFEAVARATLTRCQSRFLNFI